MKPNIGEGERLIRAILGIYAMLLGFLFIQGVVGIILGVLGAIAFATGAIGWCGLYALLGKSTLEAAPAEPAQLAAAEAAEQEQLAAAEAAEQEQPAAAEAAEQEQPASEDEVSTES